MTVADLAWFRVIFSGSLLLTLQQLGSLSNRPDEKFNPPPGLIMVFEALPPHAVLEGLEIVTAVLAAFLLLGLHTRTVSALLALALMTGFGLTYSFGKIDHTIVVVLVPATMAFSGWGNAMSIDAGTTHRATDRSGVAQWPMRFLAVMIAFSFTTAGWAKLRSGWLDLGTQAVHGHFARGYFAGRTDWLAQDVIDLHLGRWWEAADWFTVALELGLVLTVLWWRSFRVAIAVATLFHLGVLLVINIAFSWNVVGYAAFVRWQTILPSPPDVRIPRPLGYLIAVIGGSAMYALHESAGPGLQYDVRTSMVFVGAAFGAAYLAVQLVAVTSRRGRGRPPSSAGVGS